MQGPPLGRMICDRFWQSAGDHIAVAYRLYLLKSTFCDRTVKAGEHRRQDFQQLVWWSRVARAVNPARSENRIVTSSNWSAIKVSPFHILVITEGGRILSKRDLERSFSIRISSR